MTRRTTLLAVAGAAAAAGIFGSSGGSAGAAGEYDAKVELGRRLFFDPAIGRAGRIACASCHDPDHGFSDARKLSPDETRVLPRHSQPLTDLTGEGFHWDGEFDTIRDVIDARTLPGRLPAKRAAERALRRIEAVTSKGGDARPSAEAVFLTLESLGAGGTYGDGDVEAFDRGASARLGEDDRASVNAFLGRDPDPRGTVASHFADGGRYDAGFEAAFGDPEVTHERVGDAVEAYVKSLATTRSAYDRHLAGDDGAMSGPALRGEALFKGRANCSQCHTIDGDRPLFSDGKFHNTGIAARDQRETIRQDGSGPGAGPNLGRLAQSFEGKDRGAFKTPSLRDVAVRAPYMHDASLATLTDVVRYYSAGGTPNGHLDARVKKLDLADEETRDLVAFLESLTGETRAGLGAPTSLRADRITVHVEDAAGAAAPALKVVLRPAGDRLAGTSAMPEPLTALTDANGDAVFDMPLATHVVAEAEGAGATPLLPDWTRRASLVVRRPDRILLTVTFEEGATRPDSFRTFVGDQFRSGAPIVFEKLRDLGGPESIYQASPRPRTPESAACTVCLPGAGPPRVLDLTPGAANRIDLRGTAPDATVTAEALAADLARIAKFAPRGR